MTAKQSVHAGHRSRVKKRFREEGLDRFDEVNALELILFYGVPRGDTNLLAHDLLNRFGSFAQVLDAPVSELEAVSGIGEHAATLLKLLSEVSRYYEISRNQGLQVLTSTEDCGKFLLPYFVGRRDETVFLVCLDSKCKVICCKEVARGSVNTAGISVRRIVETALNANAVSVVMSHNHPSGLAIPSKEDILTTRRVAVALDAVNIVLADHIVVADGDFVSLADSGLYSPEDCRLIV